MEHKASPVGNEIVCEFYGIESKLLKNNFLLEKIVREGIKEENFRIRKRASEEFSPYGLTLAFIIEESLIDLHTYPEYGSAVLRVYSCRGPTDGMKTFQYIKSKLNPEKMGKISIREVVVKPSY